MHFHRARSGFGVARFYGVEYRAVFVKDDAQILVVVFRCGPDVFYVYLIIIEHIA